MHDCSTINSRLVDLVFDEIETNEKLRLLAELESCDACLDEYRSMTGALVVFDESVEAVMPGESYWPAHEAARHRRLEPTVASRTATAAAPRRDPLWKRIFTMRLPIPVPVAAAIALALLISSALALRPSAKAAAAAPQLPVTTTTPTAAAASPKVIEVPVFRERVITRTVYVEKRGRERKEAQPLTPSNRRSDESLTARNGEAESVQGGFFTRANLTDFQPTGEMTIRVIRRSNSDEN
jgi:anti-sigma factor RsiW